MGATGMFIPIRLISSIMVEMGLGVFTYRRGVFVAQSGELGSPKASNSGVSKYKAPAFLFYLSIAIRIRKKGHRMLPTQRPFCDPDATRTHDRLLRRQMLYPAELPDHLSMRRDNSGTIVLRAQR